jgi:hypothetical protein
MIIYISYIFLFGSVTTMSIFISIKYIKTQIVFFFFLMKNINISKLIDNIYLSDRAFLQTGLEEGTFFNLVYKNDMCLFF